MAPMVLVNLSVPGGRLRVGRATGASLTVPTDRRSSLRLAWLRLAETTALRKNRRVASIGVELTAVRHHTPRPESPSQRRLSRLREPCP